MAEGRVPPYEDIGIDRQYLSHEYFLKILMAEVLTISDLWAVVVDDVSAASGWTTLD